MTEKISPA